MGGSLEITESDEHGVEWSARVIDKAAIIIITVPHFQCVRGVAR